METLDINYIIRKEREYFKQEIKLTKKKMETLDINYIIKKEIFPYFYLCNIKILIELFMALIF